MARSVLVTGGAGFIGCNLAARLAAQGDRVTAVDVLHGQVHPDRQRPSLLPASVELIPADVRERHGWGAILAIADPDVVVHLAAETGTGQSLTEASRHASVNVVGTTELLDALTGHRGRPEHVVLASSRAVYGEGEWESDGITYRPGVRTHEALAAGQWDPLGPNGEPGRPLPARAGSTVPAPTSVYAATKLAQEHILQAWCAAAGTPLSVLRLQNVYGPGQSLTNTYTGVLVHFVRVAMNGEPIEVYEDGRVVRDFVYIDDACAAVHAALERPPSQFRLLDVGGGRPLSLAAVAQQVAAVTGAPDPVVSGRFRDGDVRAAWCSLDAVRDDLGWEPGCDLPTGLGRLVTWVGEQGGGR